MKALYNNNNNWDFALLILMLILIILGCAFSIYAINLIDAAYGAIPDNSMHGIILIVAARDTAQNLRLHASLKRIGLPVTLWPEEKKTLARNASSGRTERTSELTYDEMESAIKVLTDSIKRSETDQQRDQHQATIDDKQRRKVFAIMHAINWTLPDGKLDYERLSQFILKQTSGAKNHLKQLNTKEVNTLVSVMEKIETSQYNRR